MMMKLVGREWASRSMCMGYRVRMLMEFIACSRLGLGGVKSMMGGRVHIFCIVLGEVLKMLKVGCQCSQRILQEIGIARLLYIDY